MSGDNGKIKVGSRKSELALIQTKHVISLLKQLHPEKEFEIVTMSTLGDKILDIPLPKIGEKSLFTKELEAALLSKHVDFVVHSLKDLPTSLPENMAIGAVLTREDPRDALVLQKDLKAYTLRTLPKGSVIGTSSLRRAAQLGKKYPHLKVESIRGNLNTRLKKLDDLGTYQAIILAAAGLIRIGWKDRISKLLGSDDVMYAVGQGALAVECREDNTDILKLLEPLYDLQTALCVVAERSFLKTLGGGCSAPVAVSSNLTIIKDNQIEVALEGAVWSLDGAEEIKGQDSVNISVTNSIRCSSCPYNNNEDNNVSDIECLKECLKCPDSPLKKSNSSESNKRMKLEVPNEILENDPHVHCPVQLPVGADFMGKCPYLEDLNAIQSNCLVKGTIEGSTISMHSCPFMKNKTQIELGAHGSTTQTDFTNIPLKEGQSKSQDNENDNLFVGLVPHNNVTIKNLQKVRFLGERLAKSLMEKGALEIMTKAQSIIHSQTDVSNATAKISEGK